MVTSIDPQVPPSGEETLKARLEREKPRMDLLPPEGIFAAARAFTFGQLKYKDAPDWREEGIPVSKCLAAALRHIFKYLSGHLRDEESGLSHLDHSIARLMMARQMLQDRMQMDDTP